MSLSYKKLAVKFAQKILGRPIGSFYAPKTEYYNFDALWQDNRIKSRTVAQLAKYLSRNVRGLNGINKIVATDTVTVNFSFGTVPVISSVAERLGKDLLIWSESDNADVDPHRVFGKLNKNDRVLIVHDLLRGAITIKDVVNTIAARRCKIKGIVILINTTDATELSQIGSFNVGYPVPIYSFVS
ncbi:MAG: hypothetical protein WC980_10535 [Candidatus Brocadiia bacterium]